MIQEKIQYLEEKFSLCPSLEARYHLLMEMGRTLSPYPAEQKIEKNLVKGCQSILYLYAEFKEGTMHYFAASDALISAGLAALLIAVYHGETPETIVKTPPDFLQKIGIYASLSPMRSNGLSQLHRRIVQEALKYLVISLQKSDITLGEK